MGADGHRGALRHALDPVAAAGRDPRGRAARAGGDHLARDRRQVTSVGFAGTASYLPERWMTAAEVGAASGIPEGVVVEKFGLRGKHIAAVDEHVSDLAVAACERLLGDYDVDPESIDAVVYFGSKWEEDTVWEAATWMAHPVRLT